MTNLNLPNRRMEAWKWTDVSRAVSEKTSGVAQACVPHLDAPDGIAVSEGAVPDSHSAMGKLAQSFAPKGLNIYAPKKARPAAPLTISELTAGHARLGLMVDQGAALTVIEHLSGQSGALSNVDLQAHIAAGGSLTRIILQDDPDSHTRNHSAHIAMEAGATYQQFTLSFGGALCRLETAINVEGQGTDIEMGGAYLLDGERHSDQTSHITLAADGATVRQAVRGAVTDKARGVFQGKFHVERAGQHTDAEMRHDALMLSDRAQVRAKPELEIYADDVACAHGNTIGQIDESALFYMRQRGIPLGQARAMITQAFIAEVFDGLEDEAMREMITGKVEAWLGERA